MEEYLHKIACRILRLSRRSCTSTTIMTGIIHTITTLLLLTTALYAQTVTACSPATEECREECHAYQVAKNTPSDVPLNVEVVLSNFLNTPRKFSSKIGKDYIEDRMTNATQDACYYESGPRVGCNEFLQVPGTNCTGPWEYECDYDKNRLPLYIWRASCNETTLETVYYTVPMLKREDSCNSHASWELVMEKVPVGCTCKQQNSS